MDYRVETILAACRENHEDLSDCDAFVGQGGGLNSCPGGTYEVNAKILEHARRGGGNHPAALGSQIANKFAKQYGKRAFIVNPPDVDEFQNVARVTGLHDIFRTVSIHALNQKETAIRVAHDLNKTYEACDFIVCHIGGGVSVTAHHQGRMIDSNGILNGEGPMAPTRSGALPAVDLMNLCYSGKWTRDEMYQRITKTGGFVDHLGTSDVIEIKKMINDGNQYARLVYDAFKYQIVKQIGAMAAILRGKIDAIILTGGIANDADLVRYITEMVSFLAPVVVRAGEFEMAALAAGASRVLEDKEEPKVYSGVPVFTNFEYLKNGFLGKEEEAS